MDSSLQRSHSIDRDDQLAAVDLRQTGPRLKRLAWSTAVAVVAIVLVGWLCWLVMTPGNERYIPTANAGAWRAMGFFAGAAGFIGFCTTNWWMKRRHDRQLQPIPAATMQ